MVGRDSLPGTHSNHRRLAVSSTATAAAVGVDIPRHRRSAERFHCWAIGSWLSGLPWDEPTKLSLPLICQMSRVQIYPVCHPEEGHDEVLWQRAARRKHHPTFPKLQNRDGVQKLVVSMPDDHMLGEWVLHTPEDMRWNGNHQRPVKYWSWEIIKTMRWLMRQPAYVEHHI